MTKTEVDKYLKGLRNKLILVSNHRKILMTTEWTKLAPPTAGVYVLIENNKIIYVGESGNLRGRMKDLLDSRHHTVRRTIGKKYYSGAKGFQEATTHLKFPPHIEKLVNCHICDRLYMSFLEVPLGRKELEEYIQEEIDTNNKLNIRGKRKTM
jgi:hypothetical protein